MEEEFFAGIVMFLIGLALLLIPPEKWWNLAEKWKTNGSGGPSAAFCRIMKIVGAVFAVVGAVMMITGWD